MKRFCWTALLGTFCVCVAAQDLTMADLSRAREALTRARGLTDDDRSEISGLYDTAAKHLQQEIRWKALRVGQSRKKAVIENELAAARASAAIPPPGPPPAPPSETTQQVEDELTRVRTDRASLARRRDELSKLRASLVVRADEITARRAAILESLQSIEDEMSVLAIASASPQWEQARRTALTAQRQSLLQEVQALAMERESLDLHRRLIPVQREAYLVRQEAAGQLLDDLRTRHAIARTRDARNSLEHTTKEVQRLAAGYPQLSELAAEIRTRADDLWNPNGVEAKSDRTAAQFEEMTGALARVKEITTNTRRRYQNAGILSPANEWWPPRIEKLGNPVQVRLMSVGYSATEAVARRAVMNLEEERNAAPALESRLQALLAASGKNPGDKDFEDFKARARSLLQLNRSVGTEYLTAGRTLVNRLGEAQAVSANLLAATQELQSFVRERVLWTRSVPKSNFPSARDFASAFLWFFSPKSWSQIISGFVSAGLEGVLWIAGLLVVLALFVYRERLRIRLNRSRLADAKSGRIRNLFSKILLALLVALPGPLAIAYFGWMISQMGSELDLGGAIGAGAARFARFLYVGILLRMMLDDDGAAGRVLGWPEGVRQSLDWGVRRLTLVFVPLYAVAAALAHDGMHFNSDELLQAHHNSLGRLCFLAAVLVLLHTGRKVLAPHGAVANSLGQSFKRQGFARARLLRVALTLICFTTLLLAIAGFYVTAYILLRNVLLTVGLTLVLALVSGLGRQWRLDQEEKLGASRSIHDEEQARKADQQVRRLSYFGLTLVWIVGVLVIWSAALPALSLLKRVELMPEFRVVADTTSEPAAVQPIAQEAPKAETKETSPADAAKLLVPAAPKQDKPVEPREPLYLSGLLLAIFVGVLTSMLVGNIPGLLQFTVFHRIDLDEGGRYAANTITRYIVIFVAMAIVSAILGVNWSSVQWLAAALTFGIGFGLQEIFANFASGLILLVDRSIRVGDAVTVGTLSGVVARIQMRSTTVTLWDRSDMVVPNKEFITTKLVNWTLSNAETRVDLKVGVDYNADVDQVREVLMRLASEHPAVLKYPVPQVLLTEFGASAIQFELRVFGLYVYGRPVLLDELHRAVLREFRRLGIVIAYPQIDVHLNQELPPSDPPGS